MLTLSAAYKIEGLNIAVVVICRVNATYLCGYNWACRSMLYWIGTATPPYLMSNARFPTAAKPFGA
eukprot:1154475-Pelagomonas_calceolata.AAC.4